MSDGIAQVIATWGLRVIGAIAVIIIGSLIARGIKSGVVKAMRKRSVDESLIPFLSGLTYYLAMTFVVIMMLSLFGVQTASLVAVIGAAAFAVGFALQGTLSHFAAGVMLLIFRPFRVGEYVDAGGTAGTVLEIGIFATKLNTPDNVRIIVPNGTIYGSTIKNYATNDNRRNDLVIGISYTDDIQRAIDTIKSVLEADSRVLKEPAYTVAVSELADSSVNLVVRPWCRKEDYWGLRFDLTRTIKEKLEESGCTIPFPQTDVHLHQAGASAA